jgi:hypothetical protein
VCRVVKRGGHRAAFVAACRVYDVCFRVGKMVSKVSDL